MVEKILLSPSCLGPCQAFVSGGHVDLAVSRQHGFHVDPYAIMPRGCHVVPSVGMPRGRHMDLVVVPTRSPEMKTSFSLTTYGEPQV